MMYDPLVADALIQRYRVKGATRADYIGAVHILTRRGWTQTQIAERLDMSERQVQRHRKVEVTPEKAVEELYGCACGEHEYASKRGYYNRNRKRCTA